MYNLIGYSGNYSKTSGSLWQNKLLMISLVKVVRLKLNKKKYSTGNDDLKVVQLTAPLKHLSNSWKTLEIPLISCEIKLVCELFYINTRIK